MAAERLCALGTLLTLLAGLMTTGTWWIIPVMAVGTPGLQAFRATCLSTGRFRMARGGSPSFDPATALYATSDTVANLAANYGIAILGDVASSRRLLAHDHAWKQWMTLDQALAHPHLGTTMPKREVIIAAYADDEVIEA